MEHIRSYTMDPFAQSAALQLDPSSDASSKVSKKSPQSPKLQNPTCDHVDALKGEFSRKKMAPRKSMTLNACTACRKKRSKCDGQSPCSTCSRAGGVRANFKCVYESTARTAKKDLLRENDELRRQNTLSDQILDALRSDWHVSVILQLLKDQESLAIIAQIANLPSPIESSMGSPSDVGSISEGVPVGTSLGGAGEPLLQNVESAENHRRGLGTIVAGSGETLCPWMAAPCDQYLVKHLFVLYRTWIHPTDRLFNMEQFIQHYETGNKAHCSAFLVAAICAASCDLLGPLWTSISGKVPDVATLKREFIAEAMLQESLTDRNSKTWLQASRVMLAVDSPMEPSCLTRSPSFLPVNDLPVNGR